MLYIACPLWNRQYEKESPACRMDCRQGISMCIYPREYRKECPSAGIIYTNGRFCCLCNFCIRKLHENMVSMNKYTSIFLDTSVYFAYNTFVKFNKIFIIFTKA